MHITPEQCAAVYDCLRKLPPFDKVAFPDAEEIEFRANNRRDIDGEFVEYDPHIITISSSRHSHLYSLTVVMAHEMVHLWQTIDNTRSKSQHNADWYKKAKVVCKELGFDPKNF